MMCKRLRCSGSASAGLGSRIKIVPIFHDLPFISWITCAPSVKGFAFCFLNGSQNRRGIPPLKRARVLQLMNPAGLLRVHMTLVEQPAWILVWGRGSLFRPYLCPPPPHWPAPSPSERGETLPCHLSLLCQFVGSQEFQLCLSKPVAVLHSLPSSPQAFE